jgi:nucleoside-diphosphate-sugar epimerase
MSLLVCAGVGTLNSRIASLWQANQGTVIGLRRGSADPALPFEQQSLDLSQAAWPDLGADVLVVALSARERTEAGYRAAYQLPLLRLAESMAGWRTLPSQVVVVSSTRVYGIDDGRRVDDDTATESTDPFGQILLSMESSVRQLPCPSSVARLSGLYGPGRDWLKRMALVADPSRLTTNHWTNRIHLDDAAGAIVHLLAQEHLAESYLITDLEPVPVLEMYNYFRQREGVPLLQPIPPAQGGKRLIPTRLQASGYQWRYPNAFSGGY